jgi:hypothetical protein
VIEMTDYVVFEGEKAALNDFLKEFFPEDEISMVQNSLALLRDSLDETEEFRIKRELPTHTENSTLGLLVYNDNYFINVRKSSIALLGLILDIAFAKGFATFVLAHFGVTAEAIRKLTQDEKKFLIYVKAGKTVFDQEKNCYIIKDAAEDFSSEEIKEMTSNLKEHSIVQDIDGVLKVCF